MLWCIGYIIIVLGIIALILLSICLHCKREGFQNKNAVQNAASNSAVQQATTSKSPTVPEIAPPPGVTKQEMDAAINAKAQEINTIIDNKMKQVNDSIEKSENNIATLTVNLL